MDNRFNVLEIRDNQTAFALALVRRTGRTNMFFLNNVIDILNEEGDRFEKEVEYLESANCDYIKLLSLSGNYLQGNAISFEKELKDKELGRLLDKTTKDYEYTFEYEKDINSYKYIRFDNQLHEEIAQVMSLDEIVYGYVEDIKHRIEQTGDKEVWKEDLRIFYSYLLSAE